MADKSLESFAVRKNQQLTTQAKLKAPISATNPQRVLLSLQEQRSKSAQLEKQIQGMQIELEKSSTQVDQSLEGDFLDILDTSSEKITPFLKLFWEQQVKMRKTSNCGARFHPMIMKFCLSMSQKSAFSYDELRDTYGMSLNYQVEEH